MQWQGSVLWVLQTRCVVCYVLLEDGKKDALLNGEVKPLITIGWFRFSTTPHAASFMSECILIYLIWRIICDLLKQISKLLCLCQNVSESFGHIYLIWRIIIICDLLKQISKLLWKLSFNVYFCKKVVWSTGPTSYGIAIL